MGKTLVDPVVNGILTLNGTKMGSAAYSGARILEVDDLGKVVKASGSTLPDSIAGFAIGATFLKNGGGRQGVYVNCGTTASCSFVRTVASRTEYVIADGGRLAATAGGDATEVITPHVPLSSTDLAFAGMSLTNDTDQFLSQIVTDINTVTVVGTADPSTAHGYDWLVLRQGNHQPRYDVFAAGNFTTAGGDATESITVAGMLASDLVLVQLKTKGASPVTLAGAAAAAGAITVTMSGDPSTDHVLSYVVLRVAGSFKPSHYIFAAGNFTTVGGDADEAIAITDLLATDIAFAVINTTNDSDVLVTVAAAAGQINVVQSADPLTAHKYSYFALRAFV